MFVYVLLLLMHANIFDASSPLATTNEPSSLITSSCHTSRSSSSSNTFSCWSRLFSISCPQPRLELVVVWSIVLFLYQRVTDVVVVEFDPLYYSFRFDFRSCSCSSFRLLLPRLLVLVLLFQPSNHPCLLWLIFTTKQIIVITRRVRLNVSIDRRSVSLSCRPGSFCLSLFVVPILFFSYSYRWYSYSLFGLWNWYLIRFECTSPLLSAELLFTLSSLFYQSVLRQCINYSTTYSTATDLCIWTDPILNLVRKATVPVHWYKGMRSK